MYIYIYIYIYTIMELKHSSMSPDALHTIHYVA